MGQEPRRQETPEEFFQVVQTVVTQVLDAPAQGGQAGAPCREERSMHNQYVYLSTLDVQPKILSMNTTSAPARSLQRQYDRLRQSLAQIGYISQGSVLDRSRLRPPRSGYQWTRKVAGKTITVALSPEQFPALKAAIENERKLWKTVQQMERISRQILFNTVPHPHRRKRLSKKVLGLI